MNHFLNSFGISNYIRQMMCGIIYFIPFFLFARSSTECFLKNGQGDWSSTKLLVVAVVAACIGTLIYHVEKNLLGYSSQVFRAWCKHKCPKCPIGVTLIGMLVSLVVMTGGYKEGVVEVLIHWLMEWRISVLTAIFLATLPLFLLISSFQTNLFQQQNYDKIKQSFDRTKRAFDETGRAFDKNKQASDKTKQAFDETKSAFDKTEQAFDKTERAFDETKQASDETKRAFVKTKRAFNKTKHAFNKTEPAFDQTVKETRNAWKASSVRWRDMENSRQLHEIQEISKRESNWADFIHCGQTSAISWILGSITAVHLNQANVDSSLFWCGISIALWLLAFEFFCEWHKSLHIDYMVKQYQSFSENKK